jgi:hypothetical protein
MLKEPVQQAAVIEGERMLLYVEPNARTMPGKGASFGKEAVLAASERAGEIGAGIGRVRKTFFLASCSKWETDGQSRR